MSNNLTFKLILDGDNKGLVSATKQSQEVTTKVFETIRNEAQKVKVTELVQSIHEATKEISDLGDKSIVSASQLRNMSAQSQQAVNALKSELITAQAELARLSQTKASPTDLQNAISRVDELKSSIQLVEVAFGSYEAVATNAMVGVDKATSKTIVEVQKFTTVDLNSVISEAQNATRAIQSMGDGASVSSKDFERIGQLGADAINTLERELLLATNRVNELSQSSRTVSLDEFNQATAKVNSLEDALSLTKNSFTKYESVATDAMRGVGTEVNKTSSSVQKAGHDIYAALNIKPPTEINDAISDLSRKLDDFKKNSKLPAEEISRVSRITEQEIERLKNELRGVDSSVKNTNLGINTFSNGMGVAKFAVSALVGAMATLGVGLGIRELAQAADSYTNLSARINIATKDGGNFNQAMAGVHQVAIATNSSLEATGSLFTRLNTVGKEMGMTQQQALDLTKTVTQAIQVGGGSAQASEAAVQQFIQAMQGGTLRGEEFNSIMENGYGLAEALAKGLGVTTGELRKMAENGELSSERVIKAISSQAESVQATYNQFPLTIGQSLQKITTSWEILIGKMDQSNGASATVAQWLSMLADNISSLDIVLEDIGNGFVWVGDQLKKIDPATIEALKTALVSAYDALKSMASALGNGLEIAGDQINSILGAIFSFNSGVDSASDKTNGLTKLLQALNVVFGFVNDGFTGIKIAANLLAGVVYDVAAAFTYWKSKLLLGEAKVEALKEYEELSNKAKSYYKESSDGAMEFKSKGIEALTEISKTQKERDADAVVSSKAKLDQLLAHQNAEVDGKKVSEDEKIAAVTAYAEAAIKANNGVTDGTVQAELTAKGYMVTLDQAGKVVVTSMLEAKKATEENAKAHELAIERAKKAEQDYQAFLKTSAVEKISLNKQIEDAKKSGDLNALLSAQTSLAAIDAKEKELNQARKARVAEVDTGIQSSADKARKAAKDLGLDLDVSLNRISEGFKTNETNVVNLANGVDKLGVKGKQAGDLTYEAWLKWLETAKSQAEIDLAKAKLQEFGNQGKISTSQVEQGLIAIKLQAQKLPDDINPVTESFKRLGIETKENLKIAAQQAMMDFINVRDSGKATAEGVQKAYEKAAQAAALSGDAGAIAMANAAGAGRNLQIQVDETGKATVESMSKAENAVNSLGRAAERSGQGFREMGRNAREAAEEAKDSIQQWNDALEAKNQAQKEELNKSGTNKATGSSFGSYDRAGVIQELKKLGYTDDEARKHAGSIMSAALAKDKSMAQQTYGTGQANVFNKAYENLAKQGRTSSFGSQIVIQKLAELANGRGVGSISAPSISTPNLSNSSLSDSNQPTKTVNVNINSGNKTVKATVPVGQENDLLELLSQAKSSA